MDSCHVAQRSREKRVCIPHNPHFLFGRTAVKLRYTKVPPPAPLPENTATPRNSTNYRPINKFDTPHYGERLFRSKRYERLVEGKNMWPLRRPLFTSSTSIASATWKHACCVCDRCCEHDTQQPGSGGSWMHLPGSTQFVYFSRRSAQVRANELLQGDTVVLCTSGHRSLSDIPGNTAPRAVTAAAKAYRASLLSPPRLT